MVSKYTACRHFCSLFAILAIATSTAFGQADASKKLKDAVSQFNTKSNEARNAVIAEFNRSISQLKNDTSYLPAVRKDKMEALTEAKKLFEQSGKFPPEAEYALIELKYYRKLNMAFVPTSKVINDTIDFAIKTNNKNMADDAQEKKTKLENRLLGPSGFTSNSMWHGTFTRGKETIPFHLNIGKKTNGGLFNGHVEDNPGVAGNWAYDVEGQTSGLEVSFKMTELKRGKFDQVSAIGILSGDRLIAEVEQRVGTKVTKGLLILHKK